MEAQIHSGSRQDVGPFLENVGPFLELMPRG